MNAKVREILVETARNRDVITYGRLASMVGLPEFDGVWATHPLSKIFEVLDQEDAVAKRPFRTSVVVKSSDKTPGAGYYEAMDKFKGVKAHNSIHKMEVFISELNALYELYKN